VKRRVLVGNKTPLSRVQGRCSGFQTEGDGGVAFKRCGAKRRVVGTKPLHHSSARGVVHVERCWWCQTDSGGGQKSLRLTFEQGWLWAEAAEPPSRIRVTIVPLNRVGSVAQWWWCGWKHERNSCCRDQDLPSHWWLVEFYITFEISKKTYFHRCVIDVLGGIARRWQYFPPLWCRPCRSVTLRCSGMRRRGKAWEFTNEVVHLI